MRYTKTLRLHALHALLTGAVVFVSPVFTLAQSPTIDNDPVFNGGGIEDGLEATEGITGVSTEDPRVAIINIIAAILNFAALLAVIMIIIAGFYLVLSMGEEERKEKAKKIILYTLIGLIVILFSRIIVSLITVYLADQV